MPLLTKAAFARLAKVTKGAITQNISSGKIIVTDNKIDSDNPANAAYVRFHASLNKGGPPRRNPRKPPPVPRLSVVDFMDPPEVTRLKESIVDLADELKRIKEQGARSASELTADLCIKEDFALVWLEKAMKADNPKNAADIIKVIDGIKRLRDDLVHRVGVDDSRADPLDDLDDDETEEEFFAYVDKKASSAAKTA